MVDQSKEGKERGPNRIEGPAQPALGFKEDCELICAVGTFLRPWRFLLLIVQESGKDANREGRHAIPGLVVVDLEVVGNHLEERERDLVVNNDVNLDYEADELDKGEDSHAEFRAAVVNRHEDGNEQEELEVIGEVPGPAHAVVAFALTVEIIDVEEVRPPVVLTVVNEGVNISEESRP